MEDGGRSEEERCYDVNSKQKSTKNSFLVVSFLKCYWLAHSAEIFPYQPMIWRTWLVEKVGEEYCLGEGEYFFSVNNQRYGRWVKVRGEEVLCCRFKAKSTKNLCLVGSFLTCWLAGPFCCNLSLSTNYLEDGGEASRKGKWGFCFWGQGFFGGDWECFPCINQRFGGWG